MTQTQTHSTTTPVDTKTTPVAPAANLGDTVIYQAPAEQGGRALAALVLSTNDDGTVNLRVAHDFPLGSWRDVQSVKLATTAGEPGTFSAKPAPGQTPAAPAATSSSHHSESS